MALPAWAEWRAAALAETWIVPEDEADWPTVLIRASHARRDIPRARPGTALIRENFLPRLREAEPRHPIDFRKALCACRFRRPFDLEGIADELFGIEIARAGKRVHRLAALLPHGASGRNGPCATKPVSSVNSRYAVASKSSPGSTRPFGIVQAPASFFAQ